MFGGKDQHWTSFSISASHECGGALISTWRVVCQERFQTWPLSCQERAGWITHWLFTMEQGDRRVKLSGCCDWASPSSCAESLTE